MKKYIHTICVATFCAVVVFCSTGLFASPVSAASTSGSYLLDAGGVGDKITTKTGLGKTSPVDTTIAFIQIILGLLALIAVGLMIYAGFTWMFSQGNEEKVTKAKGVLQAAIIGLLIILAAYGITLYVFSVLEKATGQTAVPTTMSGDAIEA